MTLLIISPDYASHLLPLATLGGAWRDSGQRVVVATGPATAGIVDTFGFERVDLQLGRGSNPGVIRADEQPKGEDESLRGFFDATRVGMIETLAFQAEARLSDLMWQPVETARRVIDVVREVHADAIIVDHLAFSARLALTAMDATYADVVLGHPSALPLGTEVYGYPPAWPAAFHPSKEELARLSELCITVSDSFTREWNEALRELAPGSAPVPSAFSEHGERVFYNYPEELARFGGVTAAPNATWLGSAVRTEPVDAEVEQWVASSDAPWIYVSFGSFLSVRSDVLARVVSAISRSGFRAAIALGSADRGELGVIPASFLVREYLPQVTLLRGAAAAVTHGGNNSVTEAMTAGVPLVVLPFSTDQFAGAAALEVSGFGVALAPNSATVDELEAAIRAVTSLDPAIRGRLDSLAASITANPGPARAFDAIGRR